MKLRFCAIIASTMLAGCVLTDENNQTGGDFLSAHGGSVQPSGAKSVQVPILSVDTIPMEGVPGMHGTEDAVLGSLKGDSIRLVLGFDLSNKDYRNSYWGAHTTDTLRYVRLNSLDSVSGMKVRARFFILNDSNYLFGLLAGLEPAALNSSLANDLAETEFVIKDTAAGASVYLPIPQSISAKTDAYMRDATKSGGRLIVILDTRTGSADAKTRFLGNMSLVGHDTALTHDSTSALSLGAYSGYGTWRSIGFRAQGAKQALGLWPSGGKRLRVRVDAGKLRQNMWSAFDIQTPNVVGGFDNTFNVLQARLSVKFASIYADYQVTHPLQISSTVLNDSGDGSPKSLSGSGSVSIQISDDLKRICGFTVDPTLSFVGMPGGYTMEAFVENESYPIPTRLSLALGRYDYKLGKSFIPFGESVEFMLSSYIRVRVRVEASGVSVKYFSIEELPSANPQDSAYGVLRVNSQLVPGANFVKQEVRTPLTQILNRWRNVDLDLMTYSTGDRTNRIIAELPSDPLKLFDSMLVVARPLLGRNN